MFNYANEGGTSPDGLADSGHAHIRSVCIFGGAESGHEPALLSGARLLGQEVADAGIRLIYGGGSSGLMGAVAEGAASAGGDVVAIAPNFLLARMRHPSSVSQVIAVPDMHTRKRLMFEYADAFIALPGGIGTIEEMAEVLTWRKLAQHEKPILLANIRGVWSPWLALLSHLQQQGFMSPETVACLLVAERVETILPMLRRGARVVQQPGLAPKIGANVKSVVTRAFLPSRPTGESDEARHARN
jgi:uncharacterized protein (TIGR00730 family)